MRTPFCNALIQWRYLEVTHWEQMPNVEPACRQLNMSDTKKLEPQCSLAQLVLDPFFFKPSMGVSINGGTPIAGWFIRENSIEMGDLVWIYFSITYLDHLKMLVAGIYFLISIFPSPPGMRIPESGEIHFWPRMASRQFFLGV